jgi:hypothetical protein
MLEGFSLRNYVLLVEFTGRLFRDGKAAISSELEEILERIGSTAESWWALDTRPVRENLFWLRAAAESICRIPVISADTSSVDCCHWQ